MIPPHTIQITDEEALVLCEALSFYALDYDPSYDLKIDWAAVSRSQRIAEDLCKRLPVAIAPLKAAA